MVTQAPCGGLTPVEQSLVDHVRRGEQLDLAANDEVVDEAAMRSWGDSRTCRATVIRDILRGRLAADPDPHGLRLRGARISGRLDLENLTTDVNFELTDCLLEEGLLARDARLASVGLTGCRLEHPTEPPMDAARLTCSVLALSGARIIGHAEDGAVRLLGAHIGGQLDCDGASLRNDSGPALDADGLQVDQDMYLSGGFTATGTGEDGAVHLSGAHIGGDLDCAGAICATTPAPPCTPTACRSTRTCSSAAGSPPPALARTARSTCRRPHRRPARLRRGELRNDSGPALNADGLQVGQDMYLRGGFTATGAGDDGAVRLLGAHIGGQLDCTGAT